ncbi:MAG TPA: thioredoxin [Nitrososphaeraceae archaeon]|jgi:thioredoxin 1|nr:thioredoxin [Nitrososphaeraceae archaeon]
MSVTDDNNDEISAIMKRKIEKYQEELKLMNELKKINKPLHLTDSNFDLEKSKYHLLVVDFWAAWCGPCRMVSPIIEQLAEQYSGKIVFGKVNVDENPRTSQRFNIQSIPTLMILKEGQIVDIMIGALPKGQIENKIKQYIA